MKFTKLMAAASLPIGLSGCFVTPGQFNSTLDLRRDGSFAYVYQGEVVFQSPDEMMRERAAPTWTDDMAYCYDKAKEPDKPAEKPVVAPKTKPEALMAAAEQAKPPVVTPTKPPVIVTPPPVISTKRQPTPQPKEAEATKDESKDVVLDEMAGTQRQCTKAEIAEQKAEWEKGVKETEARRVEEAKQFGSIFGYTPGDDAANRKLAETLTRYDGYRAVTYKGKGVFQVDYAKTGRLDHDFVFPLLPRSDVIFPFVTVKRQADGSVRMSAPALIGGGFKAIASRLQSMGRGGAQLNPPGQDLPSLARGTLTVTTDGEVLTNNTEDAPKRLPNGRQLVWTIGPDSDKVPEALIGLNP